MLTMQHIPNVPGNLFRAVVLIIPLLFALAGVGLAETPAKDALALCKTSSEALQEASSIRGLAIKQAVPCVVQDKPEVETFLRETIKTELPPDKIRNEELAYKAIGLLPDELEYGKQLIAFLVEQIGGYYDPKAKQFVMASWLPAGMQHGVAVHELTHALQDQYHDLLAILRAKKNSTDSDLAISALVEGDASAVMFDQQNRAKSGVPLADVSSVDSLVLIQVMALNLGASGGALPDSLKGLLIFPYTSGVRFAHTLLRSGGYAAIERAYTRLPQSSREILHPEDYVSGHFSPNSPESSEVPAPSIEATVEYSDVLGEFGISSLFSGAVATKSKAAVAAAGWTGDRLVMFSPIGGKRSIRWLVRWETDRDAFEFVDAYQTLIRSRYGVSVGPSLSLVDKRRSLSIKQSETSVFIEALE